MHELKSTFCILFLTASMNHYPVCKCFCIAQVIWVIDAVWKLTRASDCDFATLNKIMHLVTSLCSKSTEINRYWKALAMSHDLHRFSLQEHAGFTSVTECARVMHRRDFLTILKANNYLPRHLINLHGKRVRFKKAPYCIKSCIILSTCQIKSVLAWSTVSIIVIDVWM